MMFLRTRFSASSFVFTILVVAGLLVDQARAQCVEGCLAIHTFTGEAAGDSFGWVTDDIADITGDGIRDIAIGAPFHDAAGSNAGKLYVYNAATGTLVFSKLGLAIGGRMGNALGDAGDVDGDGVTDIIVGQPFAAAGSAIVYSGATGAQLRIWNGEATGDRFGYSCKGIGDVNHDGYADVVVGAYLHDTNGINAGRAYIFSGADGAEICHSDGDAANNWLGASADGIGDVNHDGTPDFAMAAQNAGAGGGLAYVYSGVDCSRLFTLDPGVPSVNFGQFFLDGRFDYNNDGTGGFGIGRSAKDVDRDGNDDMVLGAWAHNGGAVGAGKVYIYSAADNSIFETFTHNVAGANLGFDANPQGDVNGDGRIDHLLSAASDSGGTGKVYLIAGTVDPHPIGDMNTDDTVDLADHILFAECLTGPDGGVPPGCNAADFDDEDDIDLIDYQAFQQSLPLN